MALSIIVGSLMYVYFPYWYIFTYTILCLLIGSIFFMKATPSTWRLWVLLINLICMFYSIQYFGYTFKPTVTILVMSLGIYIATYYLSTFIGPSSRIVHTIAIMIGYLLVDFGIWLFKFHIHLKPITGVTPVVLPTSSYSQSMGTTSSWIGDPYKILAWTGIVISGLGLGAIPYLPNRMVVIMYLIVLTSIMYLCLWYIINQKLPFPGTTSHIKTVSHSQIVDIGQYEVVIPADKLNKSIQTKYNYSIGFQLIILPTTGSDKDLSVININNNIDIRYNTQTGILSFWGIPEGRSDFVAIYRNYVIPLQTWMFVVINLIDGRMDIGINNLLKKSTDIILQDQLHRGIVSVGDRTGSWVKGFIKDIQISNKLYIM